MASLLLPWQALLAGEKKRYEALALACIDPRFQKLVCEHLEKEVKFGYSQVTIAGGAIGAIAPKFEEWHSTFWDNLNLSLELHRIPKVIVIQHRGCGAAKAAYGYFETGSEAETRLHRAVMEDFRQQLEQRHPQLELKAILMDLEGGFEDLL